MKRKYALAVLVSALALISGLVVLLILSQDSEPAIDTNTTPWQELHGESEASIPSKRSSPSAGGDVEEKDNQSLPAKEPDKREDCILKGCVLRHETGEPIPCAKIIISAGRDEYGLSWTDLDASHLAKGSADKEGRFEFRGLPFGAGITVVAQAPGYAAGTVSLELDKTINNVTIRIEPEGIIEGMVFAPDAGPASKVQVFGIPSDNFMALKTPKAWTSTSGAYRSMTGPDGRYRLDGLKPAIAYVVIAMLEDGAYGLSNPVEIPPCGGCFRQDVTIQKRPSVLTRILSPKAAPVEGLRLRIYDCQGNLLQGPKTSERLAPWIFCRTDSRGEYLFKNMNPGAYRIFVWPNGYLPEWRSVKVAMGDFIEVEILARPGLGVSGHVVDSEGSPVEAAEVTAFINIDKPPRAQKSVKTVTDAEGRFEVKGLPKGNVRVQVEIRHLCNAVTTVDAGSEDIRFVLLPFPLFHGKIQGFDAGKSPRTIRITLMSNIGGLPREIKVDEKGAFSCHWEEYNCPRTRNKYIGMELDEIKVFVEVPGWAPVRFDPMAPKPGSSNDLGLFRKPPERTITFFVSSSDLQPAGSATVTLSFGKTICSMRGETDEKGILVLEHVPLWKGIVYVNFSDCPEERKEIGKFEAGTIHIHCVRGAIITGSVINSLERGCPNYVVYFQKIQDDGSMEENAEIALNDSTGRFLSRKLRPGRYRIAVQHSNPRHAKPGPMIQGPELTLTDEETHKVVVRIP